MRGAGAGAARQSPERSWRPPPPCAKNSPPLAARAPGGEQVPAAPSDGGVVGLAKNFPFSYCFEMILAVEFR
jgi:hypothetical protein